MAYCNTTTDLQDVFSRIEEFQTLEILEDWTKTAGYSTVYEKADTGYIDIVYDNGTAQTLTASIAAMVAATNAFYYDSTNDKLYIDIGETPVGRTIEAGLNWSTLKTDSVNRASEIMDSYLNRKYPTPLLPRSSRDHTADTYEWPIIEACACLACYLIIKRADPGNKIAQELYKRAYNPNPIENESKGIINQYLDGDLVRQDQITGREIGNWNVFAYSSNTVTYSPVLFGKYNGHMYKQWRIQVDTAGTLGTSTYKVSFDGTGSSWDQTLQEMIDASDDEYRMYLAEGVYIYWPNTTWVADEYWIVKLYPLSDTAEDAKIGSIGARR